jgi:peptidoglycan/xylan/chitin deacetylase (PgdA/CDA1 family)
MLQRVRRLDVTPHDQQRWVLPARSRSVWALATALTCCCVLALGTSDPQARGRGLPRPHAGTRGPTIVSVEFDHAFSDQQAAVQLANSHGIKVTVFAMSGRIGLPGYMTAAQLRQLQAQGNEIGGHTINHEDLSQLSVAAQRWEICDDRIALEADAST